MTALKTELGAQTQAQSAPFSADGTIPRTNTWDAVHWVYTTLSAALSAAIAALTGTIATAQYTADEARSLAQTATGLAQKAQTEVNKIDDVQIALKAQVFN